MSSTFYGLDIAKSGLNASQIALNVTSNNIANVGTDGYTRQGVDKTTISASSGTYRFANPSVTPGKGVSADSIAQFRDDFLDLRYRNANSTNNTFTSSKSVLKSVEGIVDETNNNGLIVSFQDFYKSLQNLSQNSGDVQYSSLARSGAKTVVGMLNQYANQLQSVADEQENNLQTSVDAVNSYISKISALNKSIVTNKVNGSDCNSLMDERNEDLDKLSSYLNIEVEKNDDGSVSVMTDSSYLLDSQSNTVTTLALDTSSGSARIVDGSGSDFSITNGSIKGVLQSLNGLGSYAGSGEDSTFGIAYYQKGLDELASTFAEKFNDINATATPLFTSSDSGAITASSISISSGWTSDVNLIDTSKVTDMINALENSVSFTSGFTGTYEGFATGLMSEIATDVGYAGDMAGTYGAIVNSINNEREAISGVSTDEEAINTVKYQKAYQAAARVLTAMDEMLDKLINGTGTVGL